MGALWFMGICSLPQPACLSAWSVRHLGMSRQLLLYLYSCSSSSFVHHSVILQVMLWWWPGSEWRGGKSDQNFSTPLAGKTFGLWVRGIAGWEKPHCLLDDSCNHCGLCSILLPGGCVCFHVCLCIWVEMTFLLTCTNDRKILWLNFCPLVTIWKTTRVGPWRQWEPERPTWTVNSMRKAAGIQTFPTHKRSFTLFLSQTHSGIWACIAIQDNWGRDCLTFVWVWEPDLGGGGVWPSTTWRRRGGGWRSGGVRWVWGRGTQAAGKKRPHKWGRGVTHQSTACIRTGK